MEQPLDNGLSGGTVVWRNGCLNSTAQLHDEKVEKVEFSQTQTLSSRVLVPGNGAIDGDGIGINPARNIFDICKTLLQQPLTHLSRSHAVMAEYEGLDLCIQEAMDLVCPDAGLAKRQIFEAGEAGDFDFVGFTNID
jgi:hypothetical protein